MFNLKYIKRNQEREGQPNGQTDTRTNGHTDNKANNNMSHHVWGRHNESRNVKKVLNYLTL